MSTSAATAVDAAPGPEAGRSADHHSRQQQPWVRDDGHALIQAEGVAYFWHAAPPIGYIPAHSTPPYAGGTYGRWFHPVG